MKHYNNLCVIGVDAGYGNMKTAETFFRTGFVPYDDEPLFEGDLLFYEDRWYRIGEGHKTMIDDKINDDDYHMLSLVAIAKEMQANGITTADVHLASGLPLTWVSRQREAYRTYMMKKPHVDFRYNGVDYHINIVGCSVYPQGYSAILPLLRNEEGHFFDGTCMLADIGNGTINMMVLKNGKPDESRCWTEKLGVNQCVLAVKKQMMDHFGIELEDDVIEEFLRTGTAAVSREYLEHIHGIIRRYTRKVLDSLRSHGYDPRIMSLYILGGGGSVMKHFAETLPENVRINEDLCATAKGYEYLAFGQLNGWRKGLTQ